MEEQQCNAAAIKTRHHGGVNGIRRAREIFALIASFLIFVMRSFQSFKKMTEK